MEGKCFPPEVRTQLGHEGTRGGIGGDGGGTGRCTELGAGLGDHTSPRAVHLEAKHSDGLCTVPKSTDLPQTLRPLSTSSQTASSTQATIFRGSQGFGKHSYCLRLSGCRTGQQSTPSQHKASLERRRPRSGRVLLGLPSEVLGEVERSGWLSR